MDDLISIELRDLHFLSRHGLFREEQEIGNNFIVDLVLSWKASVQPITKLEDTINYVSVYDIVRMQMDRPTPLLETVLMRIVDELKTSFPQLRKIKVALRKLHPPISSFTGSVGVQLERTWAI